MRRAVMFIGCHCQSVPHNNTEDHLPPGPPVLMQRFEVGDHTHASGVDLPASFAFSAQIRLFSPPGWSARAAWSAARTLVPKRKNAKATEVDEKRIVRMRPGGKKQMLQLAEVQADVVNDCEACSALPLYCNLSSFGLQSHWLALSKKFQALFRRTIDPPDTPPF